MIVAVIFLIIIIGVLLTLIINYKKDIKYISNQIISSKGEYSNIRMATTNKEIEDLVLNINALYEKNKEINIKIKEDDEKLRASIANISHDLRTPLTSIMGYMQLLKENNINNNEKAKYIDIIEKRTETLQNLIVSFYELSRIECDDYKLDLKSVKLDNLLYDTIALFYEDFLNKGIEPKIDIEKDIPKKISDEDAVLRIFSNLINNMLKHGEKNICISLKKEGNFLVTEFSNNTKTLNSEDVKHIFDRFYTADVTRSNQNTGLGLNIVKSLVEKLGNEIEAEFEDEIFTIKIIWK
ncbi:MAG: sensor histidine kinase [Clostridiaceae bacterium]